jgi:hypothetical protein
MKNGPQTAVQNRTCIISENRGKEDYESFGKTFHEKDRQETDSTDHAAGSCPMHIPINGTGICDGI